jgi:hypothetical protein
LNCSAGGGFSCFLGAGANRGSVGIGLGGGGAGVAGGMMLGGGWGAAAGVVGGVPPGVGPRNPGGGSTTCVYPTRNQWSACWGGW